MKRCFALLLVFVMAATILVNAQESESLWTCTECGEENSGKFCVNCGTAKPENREKWTCPECGQVNEGNFCMECGTAKPEKREEWICPECGQVNEGNFCMECGTAKPENGKKWTCPECGQVNEGKFCTECGTAKSQAVEEESELEASSVQESEANALQEVESQDSEEIMNSESARSDEEKSTVKVGDIVTFGTFEQDDDLTDGKETIEWEVLDIKDSKALLLSRYALDCQPYNDEFTGITWEKSTLRAWINGEFFDAAFDPEEAAAILETNVINEDNELYGTKGGNDTVDRVFLLSLDELETYYGIGPNDWISDHSLLPHESLVCRLTDYGVNNLKKLFAEVNETTAEGAEEWYAGKAAEFGENCCSWWVRSSGYYDDYAAYVYDDGSVFGTGTYVDHVGMAIRPALWVNLDFDIF